VSTVLGIAAMGVVLGGRRVKADDDNNDQGTNDQKV